MPLIHYSCKCGNSLSKFFRKPKEANSEFICDKCGEKLTKQLSPPNSSSVVIVDNGLQARSTEVNLEVVKDIENRSTKDFKNK